MFLLIQLLLCNFLATTSRAQIVSNIISSVNVENAKENKPLLISVEVLQPASVNSLKLAYRNFSESDFKIVDMKILGNTASIKIPAEDVRLPLMVYYFIITYNNGNLETYPIGIPNQSAPLELTVYSQSEKEKEIIILSPTENELITMDEFFVSISLFRISDEVDKSLTKIFLNDVEITSKSVFAGDVIIFNPNNFPGSVSAGDQKLTIALFTKDGKLYTQSERFFSITRDYQELKSIEGIAFRGDFQAESRNESFGSASTFYNNFSTNLSTSYYDWTLRGYAYLTSEENSKSQPRNRFSITLQNDWMYLKAGDNYPVFPEIIMNGKRVRGFSGGLAFGFINIDVALGEVTRGLEGKYLNFYSANAKPFQTDIVAVDSAKYGQPFAQAAVGTFSRDLFAIRPSFGSGENFQLGFTYLHSKDDVKSIKIGSRPKENVVVGTDLKFAFDDQRILLKGQSAFSLINNDITNGTLSDSEIDTLFASEGSTLNIDPDLIKNIKNAVGTFITVNENIGPLNPQELSSLSAEAELQLNYFGNQIRGGYIYRGNDYNSFGQDYLRKDVAGFNINDRIATLDNKLFLTVGYEDLNDNLQQTKLSTTNYKVINSSVSYFSRTAFPDITFGFTRFQNRNNINDPDSVYYINSATSKINLRLAYNFIWNVKHNASLNFLTSSRDDKSIRNSDAKYFSSNFSLNSYWSTNLTSYFGLIYYSSEIINGKDSLSNSQKYNYFTLSAGGRYRMLENKLELAATLSPSFGDFNRQAIDFIAQYFLTTDLRLTFQARVYRIPDKETNSIFGLMLNYSF